MRANGARAWSLTAAVILIAPTGSVGLAGAQARPAGDSVADGARRIVRGVQETASGMGKTLTEGVTEVEQRAKVAGAESRPAGEKLEKSAHGFGESVWDGMKSVGRSLQKFFIGG
jgi:hypothetical protein